VEQNQALFYFRDPNDTAPETNAENSVCVIRVVRLINIINLMI
jgi:hypothetical protein